MTNPPTPQDIARTARISYEAGDYSKAANLFATASIAMRSSGDVLGSAEMDNNYSVALLKAGNAQAALSASQGTEIIFSQAGDLKRQAMALGNQAAALEALGKRKEALQLYHALFQALLYF